MIDGASDVRRMRAEQWKQAQQRQSSCLATLRKRLPTSYNVFGRTVSKQTAFLVCIVAIIAAPAAIEHVRRRQMFRHLNAAEQPDAWLRPGHVHREFVLSLGDEFVEVYSNKAPKVKSMDKQGISHAVWESYPSLKEAAITRCVTTQYAATTYFCGKQAADTGAYHISYTMNSSAVMAYYNYIKQLVQNTGKPQAVNIRAPDSAKQPWEECLKWPELVFRCHINDKTDEGVGHTFVLHILPEGGVQIYQSFITHYTLTEYLTHHGPINEGQFILFLHNIQLLQKATGWSEYEDAAYQQNFMVSLTKANMKLGNQGGTVDRARHIMFSAEPVCLAAQWNGNMQAIGFGHHGLHTSAGQPRQQYWEAN